MASIPLLALTFLGAVTIVAILCTVIVWLVPPENRHYVVRELAGLVRAFLRRR